MAASKRNEEIKKFLESTPKEVELLVKHSMDLSLQIVSILKSKKITQRELAERLGKKESEISKWLSGSHNLTLKTISKIESVLEEQILFTREEIKERFLPYLFRRYRMEGAEYNNLVFQNVNASSNNLIICEKVNNDLFDEIISDKTENGKNEAKLNLSENEENCFNNVA